jgi:hypothetical protein
MVSPIAQSTVLTTLIMAVGRQRFCGWLVLSACAIVACGAHRAVRWVFWTLTVCPSASDKTKKYYYS